MTVRRVTLAVDATHRDQAALRQATRIAAQLRAEITAMFLTSAQLQRFALLPTATEVFLRSAQTRLTDPVDLEADLQQLLAEHGLQGSAHEALLGSQAAPSQRRFEPRARRSDIVGIHARHCVAAAAPSQRQIARKSTVTLTLPSLVGVLRWADAGPPWREICDRVAWHPHGQSVG